MSMMRADRKSRESAMNTAGSTSEYNYAVFDGTDDFFAFRTALPVGSLAPDGEVVVASTGQQSRLSEFWRGQDLVIEFGSLT